MSRIQITREHPFSLEEAKQRLEPLREKMQTKFGLDVAWKGDVMRFNGRGADGKIALTEKDVTVDIKLGLLVSALKSKLEEKINEGLDKAINE